MKSLQFKYKRGMVFIYTRAADDPVFQHLRGARFTVDAAPQKLISMQNKSQNLKIYIYIFLKKGINVSIVYCSEQYNYF